MLTNCLVIDPDNFEYVDHCLGQQGGLILQAKLSEGRETEPCSPPHNPNNKFIHGWSKVINSWPEAIINFSVRPQVSSKGDSIGYIQHNFDLIYAPSKNLVKISGFACVAQGLNRNSIYIPNAQTLESGLRDCFIGNLKDLSPSQEHLYRIVELAMKNLPKYTFTPRDMQIGD